jgi:cation diffusion facilitator CzcD-associated flavoprotein CzcO
MSAIRTAPAAASAYDIVIVGAGFAGMYMLHKARSLGLRALVYEAGDGVGGTWYWNRYPGARCDIQSMEYSYQFADDLQQEWNWSEKYATQSEILEYANHVADRYGLRQDIRFETRVEAASYDERSGLWNVAASGGQNVTARWFVLATGCLSSANKPEFPDLDSFRGAIYHTGEWPHAGVDFSGLRVGVIGTGSSAIQSIPLIAAQAEQLFVFQRTPNYAIPAHNEPLDPEMVAEIKADYANIRERNKGFPFGFYFTPNDKSALEVSDEERLRVFEAGWKVGGLGFMGIFNDLLTNPQSNRLAAAFFAEKIREIVKDPTTAALLTPETFVGCKRLCVDTDYFATFNRPNVHLVDVKARPIERITPKGVVVGGQEYELDALVFATGFDAMTGSILKIDIRGRDGLALREKWAAGPRTYLGLQTAGFPNLFTITGPGSPSVLTNMLPSIEQHVNWIGECIRELGARGEDTIEPTIEAEEAWVEHVNERAGQTLFQSCNSWYLGANVPGKPRVFMPYFGFPTYVEKCKEVVSAGYRGFVRSKSGQPRKAA